MRDFIGFVLVALLFVCAIGLVTTGHKRSDTRPSCAQELRGLKLIEVQVKPGQKDTCVYGGVR